MLRRPYYALSIGITPRTQRDPSKTLLSYEYRHPFEFYTKTTKTLLSPEYRYHFVDAAKTLLSFEYRYRFDASNGKD
jgi:hypothetical protein